jgi:AcrR family transcriptional regulator
MPATPRPRRAESAPIDDRRQRTRDRLVESALIVLGRRSADARIIDELIEMAGVSRGTFYNYFRTNDELLAAVAAETADELLRIVDPLVRDDPDPASRIAGGVRLVLTVARAHPQFVRFVARVGAAALGAGSLAAQVVPRDLREGIDSGRFRIEDPRLGFDLVIGPVLATFDTLQRHHVDADHVDALAAAVLRSLGVPGATARRLATVPLPAFRIPHGSLIERAEGRARRMGLRGPADSPPHGSPPTEKVHA